MALVTTMSGVIGVLAAMALFLWFSAYIEARHLGPVAAADASPAPAEADLVVQIDPVAVESPAAVPVTVDPLTPAA